MSTETIQERGSAPDPGLVETRLIIEPDPQKLAEQAAMIRHDSQVRRLGRLSMAAPYKLTRREKPHLPGTTAELSEPSRTISRPAVKRIMGRVTEYVGIYQASRNRSGRSARRRTTQTD